MSERYPGGYITKSPPTPTLAAAPGVWTLDQAMQYIKAESWPGLGGYLMGVGVGSYGSLNLNLNYKQASGVGYTSNEQTIYYGPWNTASTTSIDTKTIYLVKDDGTLWACGFNDYGQLGINQIINTPYHYAWWPIQIGTSTDWLNAKIRSANGFVVAIKSNGTLWGWGYNVYGNLGDGTIVNRSSPVQIGAGTNWQNIAIGNIHWIATKTDGTLWSCGYNNSGQLGDGTRVNRSSPVQIGALTTWGNSFLASGSDVSYAVTSAGALWSWGKNNVGQLGQNIASTVARSSPVQVGALTTWSKIYGTGNSAFGITTSGALWAWGDASNGSLGTNNQTNRSSPVQVGALTNWDQISNRCFVNTTLARKTDGTLWSWGALSTFSASGASVSSPVQIGSSTDWGDLANGYAVGIFDPKAPVTTYLQLIFKTTKNYTWGSGISANSNTNGPLVVSVAPALISSSVWKNACTDSFASGAIKSDGTLWTWGYNQDGSLGQNDRASRSSPVQVGALTNWAYVSASYQSTYIINNSGELYAIGYNANGQLGTNDRTVRSSPVQIGALTNWKSIRSTGVNSTPGVIALKTDGTLWAWGHNADGQLGLNIASTAVRSSPVQIGAGTDWAVFATGFSASGAVKTGGTLWMWGNNDYGQLGINNRTARSSPVQVGALTNWAKLSISRFHTLAIKTDGTLWAWGENAQGQIGDGTIVQRSSPVQIGSNTNWLDVSAINTISRAITTDGKMYSWGQTTTTGDSQNITEEIYRSSPVQVGAKSYYTGINFGISSLVPSNNVSWNTMVLTNAT